MGLLGRLREGAGLVAQMAAAEGEATRLTGVTAAARAQRVAEGLPATAFIRSGAPDAAANAAAVESATKGLTLFDLPGIKVGDRFRIDPSSQLGGVSGVQGDAVVDAISANHVKFTVTGRVGPIAKSIGVEVRSLEPGTADFAITGFGNHPPLLATVRDARQGHIEIQALGARPGDVMRVDQTARGVEMVMPFGDQASTLRLVR